jgi:hypothetical protein
MDQRELERQLADLARRVSSLEQEVKRQKDKTSKLEKQQAEYAKSR